MSCIAIPYISSQTIQYIATLEFANKKLTNNLKQVVSSEINPESENKGRDMPRSCP
ncbi:MAG TPA: hypothetical protein VJ697_06715 [Nitrososphaeraceae archaeon]|nr:hypothetical protein [Nitrososphaeraceae archaeon]